ncbi:MAG: hypothetical protein HKN47_21615 [Pirellulaceae bacterium]|nr:hypothetical protein [Pirellulaceae bacterium]
MEDKRHLLEYRTLQPWCQSHESFTSMRRKPRYSNVLKELFIPESADGGAMDKRSCIQSAHQHERVA